VVEDPEGGTEQDDEVEIDACPAALSFFLLLENDTSVEQRNDLCKEKGRDC